MAGRGKKRTATVQMCRKSRLLPLGRPTSVPWFERSRETTDVEVEQLQGSERYGEMTLTGSGGRCPEG